ncbi:universal stress protein [Methylobacterium sp. Leaf106]|uniref:universal stress protein n=1 Tax=Methylobacterium sp. Leaf106 TaxID=1736255 RepID=UPI000700DB9F|nr:universal stress protein [Methylobacterium sp. Leaf106]KQP46083.1 universal stress protein UspA [Methylobacterium sp. Leaf106]
MRILVATDFSPRSQRAVRRAGILAAQSRGKVILMHVVDGPGGRETSQDIREAQRMTVEQVAVVPELYRIPCEPLVVRGCPSDEIRNAAGAHDVDLIVVGSSHRAGSRIAGPTVGKLVRSAPCPVLVARRHAASPYARVLIPVDLSDASERALRSVGSLNLVDSAHVTVLHAFEAPGKSKLSGFGIAQEQIKGYVEGCRSRSAQDVDTFLARGGMADRKWFRQVEEGSPRETIAQFADGGLTDLLVIGTHARTGLRKALFGSVTEDVLSITGPDVLVVPPPRIDHGRRPRLPTRAGWPGLRPPTSSLAKDWVFATSSPTSVKPYHADGASPDLRSATAHHRAPP